MAENFFGITDTGKMRDNNEDTFIAQSISSNRFIAACVIDGVGGYEGGEVAARLSHDAILNKLQEPSDNIIQTLKDAFVVANEKINKEKLSSGENGQMACVSTLALADVSENKFYYAHVGDTRLYLFRDNSLVKVTRDHSFVGFLEDSGRLTEEAAMRHPKRNEINKALGFDQVQFMQPDYIETGESPFLPGDILLLCSDGLSDMISNKIITSILASDKTLKEKCGLLVKAANDAGGKDNITVVLVENDKSRPQHEVTRPVISKKKEPEPETRTQGEDEVLNTGQPKKRKSVAVIILSILLIIALAGLSWFIYHDYLRKPKAVMPAPAKPLPRQPTLSELSLADSVNHSSSKQIFLARLLNSQALITGDSIVIQKDSLVVHGGGVVISADSAYHGPAFVVSSNCKYVLLDSLVLENFSTGIVVRNAALHLKYVQFRNCGIPVQHEVHVPGDRVVSGKISDSSFLKFDSVKTKH